MEVAISPALDQYPEVTTSPDPAEPTQQDRQPNPTFRLVLLVVLLVLLIIASATLGWLLLDRRGQADDLQADREAVMSQAEQFVLRLNTLDPSQLDDSGHLTDYQERVSEVVTPKFETDFEANGLPLAEQLVTKSGYARTAEVFGQGVESLDGDSATVIIAAGLTGSYPDPKTPDDDAKRVQASEDVLRWEIKLVNTGGKWLVDDYAPVTGEGAQ